MFYNADSANPDVSSWNTSNITNMASVFNASLIINPDVSNWVTSNVTAMNGMFNSAPAATPVFVGASSGPATPLQSPRRASRWCTQSSGTVPPPMASSPGSGGRK